MAKLDIGDAVLTVYADTSQLDAALAAIPEKTQTSMNSAQASMNTLAQTMVNTGQAGNSLADAVRLIPPPVQQSDQALQNMAFALRNVHTVELPATSEELHKARGQMALLNDVSRETFGISLPRHVRSFIAELPGLTSALSAAFSATAVLFLVDAVAKVGEKLGGFIADTFIYTDVMKKMDAETAKANTTLLDIAGSIKKANTELEQFGMTAAQKTQLAIEHNITAFADNARAISDNQTKLSRLKEEQQGWGARLNEMTGGILNTIIAWDNWSRGADENTGKLKDNREEINKLTNANVILGQKQKELTLELAILSLQLRDQEDAARQQSLQKQNTFNEAKLKGAQTVGNAMLQLQKAQADAEAALNDASGAKRILIGAAYDSAIYQLDVVNHQRRHAEAVRFENETYQLQLANLQNRIALEKTMGPAGIASAKSTEEQILQLTKAHNLTLQQEQVSSNAEIEGLVKNHEAKLVQTYADMMARVKATIKTSLDSLTSSDAGWDKFSKDAIKAATDVENAFNTLGITGSVAQLTKALEIAQNAYSVLHKSGLATAHDLALANLAVLQSQLALNRAMGDTTAVKNTEKEIERLTKDLDTFEGATKKAQGFWDAFSADFKKKAHDDGTAGQQMGRMIAEAMRGMQQAFESSIAAAITSQDAFGAALEKSTAQIAAQLAAQAAVKAIYFTAMGIAELAAGITSGTAAEWFHAAALMGIVAAGAGAAARGMSGGAGGSAGGGGNTNTNANIDTSKPENRASGQSTSTANVPHLSAGGLAMGPTFAVVGDAPGGEAILPLHDHAAMHQLAAAIVSQMQGGSNGITQNFNIRSMISTQDLVRTGRMLTRGAQTGRLRVTVSNSGRVIRRG